MATFPRTESAAIDKQVTAAQAAAQGSSTPAAGSITQGSGQIAAGAVAPDHQGLIVANKTGSGLTAGQLVYLSGYDTTLAAPTVALADAKATNKRATWVVPAPISNNASGLVVKRWLSAANLDTHLAGAVGSLVYADTSNGTIGGWITASPAYRWDTVGVVVVKDASVGQIYFDLEMCLQSTTLAGNQGDITAATIGQAQIAGGGVSGTQLTTVGKTKTLQHIFSTIATTGAEETLFVAPCAGTLSLITISAKDALATDDTNYLTWSLVNKGQAGAGSQEMTDATSAHNTTKTTGGQALVAYGKCVVPVDLTAGHLVVAQGDTLVFKATASGTLANTVTEGVVSLDFTFTT